ncbi:hypothetical protein ZWY2020_025108 [Hordeum vulgare]|nr:hypothetical protein ZWY2020_025108 [Hordeum vulgare]
MPYYNYSPLLLLLLDFAAAGGHARTQPTVPRYPPHAAKHYRYYFYYQLCSNQSKSQIKEQTRKRKQSIQAWRADIAQVPPSAVAAASDLPKQVRPAAQNKKGQPQHHHASAADKEAAKKHHHLDLNTLRGHTDFVTALDFSSNACNLTTSEPTLSLQFDQDLSCLRTETF